MEVIESTIMLQVSQSAKVRALVANAARSLAVKGKIDVLGDGSLQIIAQGRKETVEALIGKIRGMPGVETSNVLQTIPASKAKEGFLGFRG